MNDHFPLVSVCIVTYNHENFISKCLDGVLMQKTNFPFEIILGEDDSCDRTREICQNYALKYPNKIKLFLRARKDVIYINGIPSGRFNFLENLKEARGKYIALCEGDDFWTDCLKLQKQIDFLESNHEFIAHCHNVYFRDERMIEDGTQSFSNLKSRVLNINDICPIRTFHTASLMFHAKILKELICEFSENIFSSGDKHLYLILFFNGKIYYDEENWAFYRRHIGGHSTSKNLDMYMSSDVRLYIFFSKKVNNRLFKLELIEATNYYKVERFIFLLKNKFKVRIFWYYILLIPILNKSKYLSINKFKKISKQFILRIFSI